MSTHLSYIKKLLSFLALLSLVGCANLGPDSISAGRMSYSEAISATSSEQLLQVILRDRYMERMVPLSVSSITANMRVSSNFGVNLGVGDSEDYEGNLVPISAGIAYEENPTISYTPVENPAYLNKLLSPVPLDTALLMIRSSADKRLACYILLERINNLKNPKYSQTKSNPENFINAVNILTDFIKYDLVEFVSLDKDQYGLLFQIDEIEEEGFNDQLYNLMKLLKLDESNYRIDGASLNENDEPLATDAGNDSDEPRNETQDAAETGIASADINEIKRSNRGILVFKLRFSAVTDSSSIAITTNSVSDMLQLASNAIEVPQEHIDQGLTNPKLSDGFASRLIHIKRSKEQPRDALVASQLHDWWYYIDSGDLRSKTFFKTLSTLYSIQISSSGQTNTTPLLTVPVSR